MCFWGLGEQASGEMGSAQYVSGLEWEQGYWIGFVPLVFLPGWWGSHIGQEYTQPAFCEMGEPGRGEGLTLWSHLLFQ